MCRPLPTISAKTIAGDDRHSSNGLFILQTIPADIIHGVFALNPVTLNAQKWHFSSNNHYLPLNNVLRHTRR